MAGKKPRASGGSIKNDVKKGKVVAHPNARIRDVEELLCYVKRIDKERGRR